MIIKIIQKYGYFFALAIGSLAFITSCQEDLPPNISEISKGDRERLGDEILIYIEDNSVECNVIFETDYPFIYKYIQEVYDFATFFPKEDLHSPENNHWDKNHKWKIVLLDQDAVKAFCLPGGHFIISTGMLKKIKYEFELFYIMNFEIALMEEKYLLRSLVQINRNPQPILEVAYGRSTDDVNRESLGKSLAKITYDPSEYSMRKLDSITCNNICKYSTFSNLGLVDLLPNKITNDDVWLVTRPTYLNREEYINKFGNDQLECSGNKWGKNGPHFFRDSIISRLP